MLRAYSEGLRSSSEVNKDALEPEPWQATEWISHLVKRLGQINFDDLRRDLSPFLIEKNDLMLIDQELLINELKSVR